MNNIENLSAEITYLEDLVESYLENGLNDLAIKTQSELDKLYDKLSDKESKIRKKRAERVFMNY